MKVTGDVRYADILWELLSMNQQTDSVKSVGMTKWKFNCHKCGHAYQLMHRSIPKSKWLQAGKKGRPHINCVRCPDVLLVGEMVGNRG